MRFLPYNVHVKFNIYPFYCWLQLSAQASRLQGITFYPPTGFPFSFYPWVGQAGYLGPLVMAQLDLVPGPEVSLLCSAWAANIHRDTHDLQGSVLFSIQLDPSSV